MQGLEAWPPCHGSGDRNAAAEVTVAIRDDGYIARRAQDAILGCPAGAAFQHAAVLVPQLIRAFVLLLTLTQLMTVMMLWRALALMLDAHDPHVCAGNECKETDHPALKKNHRTKLAIPSSPIGRSVRSAPRRGCVARLGETLARPGAIHIEF